MTERAERLIQGERVYLLTELRVGRQIHEIGTRGSVLADHGAVVVLHLEGSDAEVVTCPSGHVARVAERVARTPVPRPTGGWLRPRLG